MKSILLLFIGLSLVSCALPKTLPPKPINIRTTAYCGAGEKDHVKYGNKTAIGTPLKRNKSIAADLSIFPIGTKLKIGNIVYEVDDYGSALVKPSAKIPTIDIYKPTRSQMNKWGVKYFTNVEVVEWGSYEKSAKLLKDRLRYPHCRVMYHRIQQKL